jgi:hypothetical protein
MERREGIRFPIDDRSEIRSRDALVGDSRSRKECRLRAVGIHPSPARRSMDRVLACLLAPSWLAISSLAATPSHDRVHGWMWIIACHTCIYADQPVESNVAVTHD